MLLRLAGSKATLHWAGAVYLSAPDTTNNSAEYAGLILGLQEALDRGVDSVHVVGDSDLLRRQLLGHFRVRGRLRPLHTRALELLDRLDAYTLVHHRRAYNKQADYMANASMDAQASITLASPSQLRDPAYDCLHQYCLTDVDHFLQHAGLARHLSTRSRDIAVSHGHSI